MVAKVTEKLKRNFLDDTLAEVTNATDYYYVGIARSNEWDDTDTPPDANNTQRGERQFRQAMQSVKLVADASYCVPRYNWTNGTTYFAFDDNTIRRTSSRFYVLTEDNQVYICLQSGKNADGSVRESNVKPSGTSTKAFRTNDGYVWKYLFTIGGTVSSNFLTANFMPVEYISDSSNSPNLTGVQANQATVREAAVKGQILGIDVTAGGTGFSGNGFSDSATITITGDGSGAAARAFISSGTITRIELDSISDGARTFGQNYTYADVTITGGGGSGATARAILSPQRDSGLGSNPVIDLKATSLIFNAKPNLNEEGADGVPDWPIVSADRSTAEYRQIGLLKNITDRDGTTLTADTGRVSGVFYMDTRAAGVAFKDTRTASETATGAECIIDDVDSDRVYFHQTEETGFTPFSSTGTLTDGASISETFDSVDYSLDVDRYSGEVFYIENREKFVRSAGQSEDIKVIITL
jgi:hypothetical protein